MAPGLQSMLFVALGVLVLALAPLLAALLQRRPALVPLLDNFVLVAVGGIVILDVVPHSAARAGPAAIGAAVVGLFLPIVLHQVDELLQRGRTGGDHAGRAARDAVLLGALLVGTFIHAFFDGTALAGAALEPGLALGVLLHRLPVGLALWVIVRPALGLQRMLLVAAALVAGTVAGALLGEAAIAGASGAALALVQAFIAGSILHIVAESPPVTAFGPAGAVTTTMGRAFGLAGAALAAVSVFVLDMLHGHAEHAEHAPQAAPADHALEAGDAFLALAFDVAPAVVLSFVLVGFLTALYPPGAPPLGGRGVRVVDAAVGVGAGLPHPLCTCTVAPLYTTLLERGTSPAAARAFLVAAPELGVPAVLLSARLLGLPFTAARVVGAALLAWLVGLGGAATRAAATSAVPAVPFGHRLRHGLRHGLFDAVDHVGPWILLGLGVAALLEPALDEGALSLVPPALQTILLAVLALPLYLCAAGATPLAALLVHKGVTAGAALAFLLVAPATSMPTLQLVRRLHGRGAATTFALLVVGGAVAAGLVAGPAFGLFGVEVSLTLHERADLPPSWLEQASLIVATALLLVSLARQGVRGFLVQIMSPQHTHAHDHEHGPGCDHDHGPPLAPLPGAHARRAAPQDAPRVALSFDPRAPAPAPPTTTSSKDQA